MKLIKLLLITILSGVMFTACSDDDEKDPRDKYNIKQFPSEGVVYTIKLSDTKMEPFSSVDYPDYAYSFEYNIELDFYYEDESVYHGQGTGKGQASFRAKVENEEDAKYFNISLRIANATGLGPTDEDGIIYNGFKVSGYIKKEYENLSEEEKKNFEIKTRIYIQHYTE